MSSSKPEDPVYVRSAEAAPLVAFVRRVLDALGVAAGAAHTEVMLTRSGPVLIETGARLGGATLPRVVEKYCGTSQTRLLADTLADPARFAQFDDAAVVWSQPLRNVALVNRRAGTVPSLRWAARIEALPAFAAMVHGITPGMWLSETSTLMDSPGFVCLTSADACEIGRDYAAIRQMEREGLDTG